MQNGLNGLYEKEEIVKSHQNKDKKKMMSYMNGKKAEKTNKSNNGK